MRTKCLAIWAAAVLTALPSCSFAQRNPRGKSEVTVSGKTVSVDYGRPSLRGRKVTELLSQLSAGDAWRLGADQSTTLTSSGDLSFGNVKVPKGTYSLWAQKQADNSWKLIFNKQHGQWGVTPSGEANRDPKLDVASVPLTESKADSPAEQVTIDLAKTANGGSITILWGEMKLATNFQ